MAFVYNEIVKNYQLLEDLSDPRVAHYPLMQSPFPVIILCIAYNYFIYRLGPNLMAKRAPIELKNIMIIYNLIQILINGYFVEESFRLIWFPMRYNIVCEEVDYSDDPLACRVVMFVYLFLITKILDLIDTIFMVLRKKESQISFLHVYHHTGMVIACWIAVKYVGGGHVVFFGTVNSFVHTIMYSYYLLTALYPQYKKSIWWKKHITELQLIQFVITSVQGLLAFIHPTCNFPKFLLAAFIPQDVFMFFLFLDFYKKTYWKKNVKDNNATQNGKEIKEKSSVKINQEPGQSALKRR